MSEVYKFLWLVSIAFLILLALCASVGRLAFPEVRTDVDLWSLWAVVIMTPYAVITTARGRPFDLAVGTVSLMVIALMMESNHGTIVAGLALLFGVCIVIAFIVAEQSAPFWATLWAVGMVTVACGVSFWFLDHIISLGDTAPFGMYMVPFIIPFFALWCAEMFGWVVDT